MCMKRIPNGDECANLRLYNWRTWTFEVKLLNLSRKCVFFSPKTIKLRNIYDFSCTQPLKFGKSLPITIAHRLLMLSLMASVVLLLWRSLPSSWKIKKEPKGKFRYATRGLGKEKEKKQHTSSIRDVNWFWANNFSHSQIG